MAKFKRIKTRITEFGETFPQPEWQEGYEFESNDYNGISGIGSTYAKEKETGLIHSWDSVKRID